MPEGDTIHRIARRLDAAMVGREVVAEAPDRRSPLHSRAGDLSGRTLERVEARGKHLLLTFSGGMMVHSHLGMNGRWFIRPEGDAHHRRRVGYPWLRLTAGEGELPAEASQARGKLLRMGSAAKLRHDPTLLRLGPDPLAEGFDVAAGAACVLSYPADRPVGEALIDQGILAGVGNVIRIEACFAAGVSPERRVADVSEKEAAELVAAAQKVMEATVETGRRPKQIYGRSPKPCSRCGGRIASSRQGDDARLTIWCPGCQT